MTREIKIPGTSSPGALLFLRLIPYLIMFIAPAVTASVYAQTVWKDAVIQAKGDAGFFWMAQNKGFFKKHALTVKYIQFRGDKDVMRALLAGQVDSAELNPAPVLNAIDRGETDLRFVGAPMPGLSYALYVRKDITSWAQLKGKTFGVSAPGSQPDIIAREMLARKGVDPNSIKIVNAGGSGSRIKALIAGKIDAAASGSEYSAEADKLGIKVMAFAADLVPEYPRMLIVVKEGTLKKRHAAMVNFLAAYMEGLDYAVKHRADTLNLAAQMNDKSPKDPTLNYIYHEVVARKFISTTLRVPRDKIEWLQGQLLKTGAIRKKIDLDNFIDESFRKEALKDAHIVSKD